MSFGFGVGDFLATLQLADDLKKRFAQAPSGFKAISGDVKSLWALLHDLNDIPNEGLSTTQKMELDIIVQRGREVLLEIEHKLSKYNVLAFATSDWKTKAVRAWSRVKWDPAEVDSMRSRITYCLSLWNLVMGKINQDLTLEIGAGIQSMKGHHDMQQRNETLAWICPVDVSEQKHRILSSRREGTGEWFLESEEFRCWISDEKSKVLLCTGAPGAGKTMLSSIAVDHFQQELAHNSSVAVAYHYFNYQERLEFTELLSSLLRQLLQGNQRLYETITKRRYLLPPRSTRLTKENIKKVFDVVLSECSEVLLVVDALDECNDVYVRRQFLAWTRNLLDLGGRTKVKLLATARPGDYFGTLSSRGITLEVQANRDDMESFLDGNLDYLPGFLRRKPELWGYIRNQILESADGIFLLVRLYYNLILDEKNERRVRALGSKFQSGSGAYDHAYEETLKRISLQSSFSQDLAKRVLGWITFSARPLSALELQHAIAVEIGEPDFDKMNVTDIEEIVSACCGLITVDKSSNTAKLVHLTAQEYLKRTWKAWYPTVHEYLTDTCLTYVSFDAFDPKTLLESGCQEHRQEYPFYQYAATELGNHLRQSLGSNTLLASFIKNDVKVSRCMREMFGLSDTAYGLSGIHLASLFGLDQCMEELVGPESNFVNTRDYLGRTPLTWAAGFGNSAVVEFLLDHGAIVDSATAENFTPLFYAAAYGHHEVARLLIGRGANVHYETENKETPIFFAAKSGAGIRVGPISLVNMGDHAQVMKVLRDASADINRENKRWETPLFIAAANGNLRAVELLLEWGARISSTDKWKHHVADPLTAAAQRGHVEITRLLLVNGAGSPRCMRDTDVSPYFWGLSCLTKAEVEGDDDAMEAILRESCSPGFRDEFHRLPLHWAASRGDISLVQRILKTGCDPNPRDIFGRTPLFAAICMGQVKMVEMLLEIPNIEPHIEDKLGFTPLQESYRRKIYLNDTRYNPFYMPGITDAGAWDRITDLLKAKAGLPEEDLVHVSTLPFVRYILPQAPFYEHCDVCLDTQTLGKRAQCRDCPGIAGEGGASKDTVTYCRSCIQSARCCPLCTRPFDGAVV
ncbi:hypothetical protein AnigIFM59636_010258 [Aspergillus niger]|nr:hypothetical protein AnigIFM59636_010258 [Aspergillus niger]GLA27347.1 hypothetical protein AnigIFM63326_004547 [Aspergillus niger]SPB45994.1 unnamed protein product [Aspergillus niger]